MLHYVTSIKDIFTQKKDAIYQKQRPYLHFVIHFILLILYVYSILFWRDIILFSKFAIKITCVIIANRPNDVRYRHLAMRQQINRLVHPLDLQQLFIRLTKAFFNLAT